MDRRKEQAGAAAVLKLLKEEGGREVLERARGEGCTALHYVAQYQLSESVKALIEEGREEGLERRTRDEGNTLLGNLFEQIEGMNHPAAVATMRVLIEGGANLETVNEEGNTLLHLAVLRQADFPMVIELCQYMRRKTCTSSSPPSSSSTTLSSPQEEEGESNVLKIILSKYNNEGETPFLSLLRHRRLGKACARGRAEGEQEGWKSNIRWITC